MKERRMFTDRKLLAAWITGVIAAFGLLLASENTERTNPSSADTSKTPVVTPTKELTPTPTIPTIIPLPPQKR